MEETLEETKNICIQTGLPCGMQCLSEDTCNRTKFKQETLEEVAENFWLNDDSMTDNDRISYVNGFIAGVKWQQEIMYSEKEVLELLNNIRLDSYNYGMGRIEFSKWFEQFKKK